jgi:adenylate cyclase
MFTDIVGYTTSTQANEAESLRSLQEQEDLVRPVLAAHRGRDVKSTGDGFLVEFDSALAAVQCAIGIHEVLRERNARPGVSPIRLRIGVHLGDVVDRGGDIFGDAVNIASRIEPLAVPGGICISGQVYDQVRNKIPNKLERLPPTTLKHIRIPVDVYRVTLPWEDDLGNGHGASRARLAVLPLANISPDPKDEYFADGLTEELISTLSKIRDLRVIARTSVSQYKSTSKPVSQIGAELEVGSVLEGSVRKAGNRLRITLQLIDVTSQEHIWASTYDRELDDVFAIQSEIAERTAGALRLELVTSERASIERRPTSNLEAYNNFLKGLNATREWGAKNQTEAAKFFEDAIKADPDFSAAYAMLAMVCIGRAGESLAPSEAFPRAAGLISKALDLDPNSPEGHAARGNLALQHEQDWELAERELRLAISLNPSNAGAHWWYAMLHRTLKRFDEAIAELRTTIALDPFWEIPEAALLQVVFISGKVEVAISMAEVRRDANPGDPRTHLLLALFYSVVARKDDARRELVLLADSENPAIVEGRALAWATIGVPEPAREWVSAREEQSKTGYVSATEIAACYSALGERDRAVEWLDRDYESGDRMLWFSYLTPAFDPIRKDPRFQSLLKKMNLPVDPVS